jgi:signal transduction histidine kinase
VQPCGPTIASRGRHRNRAIIPALRPRPTILVKLLVAFAVPTAVLFGLFAVVAHEVARRGLDDELGTRLTAVAASAATQVRGKYLAEVGPGDEGDRGYQNALHKLEAVAAATGARLYVFDRNFDSRADTGGHVAIGTHEFPAELDRAELRRVFADGAQVASVTFVGDDGRTYKAGYAPLRASEDDPTVVLAIGAQAPADYFDQLADLRQSLLLWGGVLVIAVLIATVVVAAVITRPIRVLAGAAERIGAGDLAAPVTVRSSDELGRLAAAMEHMRAQLAERDAHMQRMLAGIAHEVRNPLAGMTLFTGLLQDELPEGDERRTHVLRIARELGYLDRVVSEFLDYARRPRPERGAIDARALLGEVADLAGPDAAAAGVTIEVAGDPDDEVGLDGDAGQLRRAILNLARNAVQASPAGEVVTLAARRARAGADDAVELSVANHGVPIPPDAIARIFDPFFTTREKGTGLGLAFVRDIARDHGGAVEVTSEGSETVFRLIIPSAPRPRASAPS